MRVLMWIKAYVNLRAICAGRGVLWLPEKDREEDISDDWQDGGEGKYR